MKRITSFLMVFVMLFSMLGSVSIVQAADNKAGDNITWSVTELVKDKEYRLTFSGTGDMYNYGLGNYPQWMANCPATEIVFTSGITSIGDYACFNILPAAKVMIPNTVKRIGTKAFSGCRLTSVNIPASVEKIGDYAFSSANGGAYNITDSITVDSNSKYFTVYNGVLYNKAKTIIYKAPSNVAIDTLSVPSSVVQIKDDAFTNCKNISEVNLPVSVEAVGRNAFSGCKNLTKVAVNNSRCDLGLGSIPDNAGLNLYGYKDSTAELYIKNNGCKNIHFEPLDACAAGHTPVTDKAVPATCTKSGLTEGVHCDVCGYIIKAQTTVKATGHKYDSGKVTKAATCTQTGTKTYTCTVCKATKTETIAKKAHTYKNYVTKATTSKNGSVVNKCSVCAAKKSSATVYKISSVALSTTATYYNGSVKTPGVTVKDSKGKTLKKGTDYDVTYASGRKNVGRYAVTVKFKGNYSGSKTLYFNVIPKGVSKISKVTAKSKGFTVQWATQKTQTTGYQIQYSTASNFSNAKTITMPKNTYYAKSITGLAGNKKYYVRVRTYKTVKFNGKNYNIYSPWCASKAVTTKK